MKRLAIAEETASSTTKNALPILIAAREIAEVANVLVMVLISEERELDVAASIFPVVRVNVATDTACATNKTVCAERVTMEETEVTTVLVILFPTDLVMCETEVTKVTVSSFPIDLTITGDDVGVASKTFPV